MIKFLLFCAFIISISCTAKSPGGETKSIHLQKEKDSALVANELLVKFQTGTPEDEINNIIASCGGTVIKHLEGINVFHVKVTSSSAEGINCFQKSKAVKYAEPNRVVKIYK